MDQPDSGTSAIQPEQGEPEKTLPARRWAIPRGQVLAIAAGFALIVAAGLWAGRGRGTSSPLQTADGTAPAGSAEAATGTARGAPFPVTLTTGAARAAGDPNTITVPADAERVRLLLPIAREEYPQYRASLQTANGEEIVSEGPLTVERGGSGPVVSFELPAATLSARTFVVTLSGVARDGIAEPVSEYVFRVAARDPRP
jgi:hypothetical protein